MNKAKLSKIDAALASAQQSISKLMDDDVFRPTLAAQGSEVWGQIEDLRKKMRKTK